eukprot:CAMPEP_0201508510 /NCGR_PEP_ID=MMETSP0161_2-20130828/1864_1 /ASSEMBLY_ACC=CAM_ASM_000251 /TAXON_ID=180227 /ORGANISM="Neoparamoeba aestuarina, Strain SoJaBio B1-5/56/2" /LENGTH=87 /DNA_ID=CAMNT_0047903203 /DNA_START=32 /DNA_END=295 /DNA_ORIENTATION=+
MVVLSLFLIDPSIGRIEKASLPQQTLMELLISDITVNRSAITLYQGDISEWNEVFFEAGQVVEINWECKKLEGTIDLKWLPPGMEAV